MNKKIAVLFVLLSVTAASHAQVRRGQKYSEWAPIVHLPAPINSQFDDHAAILSKDEKTMYFTSNRTGSVAGSEDIWVPLARLETRPGRRRSI